jgi:hypothetical protein
MRDWTPWYDLRLLPLAGTVAQFFALSYVGLLVIGGALLGLSVLHPATGSISWPSTPESHTSGRIELRLTRRKPAKESQSCVVAVVWLGS